LLHCGKASARRSTENVRNASMAGDRWPRNRNCRSGRSGTCASVSSASSSASRCRTPTSAASSRRWARTWSRCRACGSQHR
jgi:hypothetical protein